MPRNNRLNAITLLGVCIAFLMPASCKSPIGIPGADCMWSAKVIVWRDDNRNGLVDAGEPVLPGVRVFTNDTYNHYNHVHVEVSDADGKADQYVWLPGCPRAEFEVTAEPPFGFTPTTAAKVNVNWLNNNDIFRFGFVYTSPLTPTPRPLAIALCAQFYNANYVKAFAAAPDGTIWAATDHNKVSRIDAKSGNKTDYSDKSGLAYFSAWGVAVDSDGVVWFATFGGASRFDGNKWTTYRKNDGLLDDQVIDVAVTPDKSVWFATRAGVSQFRPESSSWTSYTEVKDLGSRSMTKFHVSHDGSLWLITDSSIHHLEQPSTSDGRWRWTSYKESADDHKSPMDGIGGSALAPDGSLWISGATASDAAVGHLIPETGQWIVYNNQTTNGAMLTPAVNDIAVSNDGVVWIATWPRGIIYLLPGLDPTTGNTWGLINTVSGPTEENVSRLYALPSGEILVTYFYNTLKCRFQGITKP